MQLLNLSGIRGLLADRLRKQVRSRIEAAVMKASPLPRPSNNLLFDTNLRFIFKPEQ
jgi:hypothetical protein